MIPMPYHIKMLLKSICIFDEPIQNNILCDRDNDLVGFHLFYSCGKLYSVRKFNTNEVLYMSMHNSDIFDNIKTYVEKYIKIYRDIEVSIFIHSVNPIHICKIYVYHRSMKIKSSTPIERVLSDRITYIYG
jgi:hypothetical protein